MSDPTAGFPPAAWSKAAKSNADGTELKGIGDGHSSIPHFIFLCFCTQVLWRIAVGDILFGIHALPQQKQPGGSGVCHQWRKDGST